VENRTQRLKPARFERIFGTVENVHSQVFITFGEPQAHVDTAEPVPFRSLGPFASF
jgi:hypothetical protein